MSLPFTYMGKEGMNQQTNTGARGFGFFTVSAGGQMVAWAASGGATPSVYLVYAIGNFMFGAYILCSLLGLDGGNFKSTQPTTINKLMMASWVPAQAIFGLVFILCADFDNIPVDLN